MRTTIYDIQDAVCGRFKLSPEDLRGPRRSRRIARPRQILMYLARKEANYSLPRIGEFLGGRDHTTIMHGVNRIHDMRLTHPKIAQYVDDCRTLMTPTRLSKIRREIAASMKLIHFTIENTGDGAEPWKATLTWESLLVSRSDWKALHGNLSDEMMPRQTSVETRFYATRDAADRAVAELKGLVAA